MPVVFGFRDDRFDAALAAGLTKRLAAVGLVGQQRVEAAPWPAGAAGDRWVAVEQVEGAADVGHVRARGEHVDRGAVAVADQVMFAAGLAGVDRRCDCRPSPPATSRSSSPRSTGPAGVRGPGRTPQHHSSGPAGASRSSRSRTRVPAASLPSRSRYAARTRSLAGTADPGPAAAQATWPATAATTARSAPTARHRRQVDPPLVVAPMAAVAVWCRARPTGTKWTCRSCGSPAAYRDTGDALEVLTAVRAVTEVPIVVAGGAATRRR